MARLVCSGRLRHARPLRARVPQTPHDPSLFAVGGSAAAALSLGSTSLGKVLVDAQGFTLYLFAADTPTSSECAGSCASAWPTATVTGTPVACSRLSASLVTALTRADGTKQLEYNGHPLYTFKGDTAAGQANGECGTAFGAYRYVLDANGDQKRPRSSRQSAHSGS